MEGKPVCIIGNLGMLGRDLEESFRAASIETLGLNRRVLDVYHAKETLEKSIKGSSFVINCLAFTAVDDAEINRQEANFVNGKFPDLLARVCASLSVPLLHVSSDYVFDGRSREPRSVLHDTDPLTAYGYSKLLGEQALLNHSGDFVIFRTAWLYGAFGKNFPRTIARKLLDGETVRVVEDQCGSPTWTKDLSKLILEYMAVEERPKIVHATASGAATWFEFAQEIAASLGLDPDACVKPVPSSEFETLAKRPKYSVLNNSEGPIAPIGDWRERWRVAAPEVLANLD